MKRRGSTAAIVFGLMICICFFLLQMNFSSTSRLIVKDPSTSQEIKRLEFKTRSKPHPLPSPPPPANITCDRSHFRYDVCSINGPTVLDPVISTFFAAISTIPSTPPLIEKIRPYPRKWENFTMSRIKELTLTSGPRSPPCKAQHNAPALVFSAGGYTGNFFHDFNDGFIPLFITVNSIFPDQDFVLVISKARDWWVSKYADLLRAFSKHPIVKLDNDTATHCFPSAKVGLISHGFMTIEPTLIPNKRAFIHFRSLLEKAYGQKAQNHPSMMMGRSKSRPRLVLASRSGDGGRVILNQAEVKRAAEEEGFEVIVFEPKSTTPLPEAYGLINSSHAMVGVHGAALTHSLFLRPGSVFMQVVPVGNDWVAEACFGKSARDLGLEYMEYKIGVEESSLVEKYGKDDLLLKDPIGLQRKGWSNDIMSKYLKEQNVKVDLVRFKGHLKKAYKKANKFMDKEG